MRCSNCGKKLADGETFCPICGQKAPVQRTQAYTPPPPPPPQPTPPPAPQPIPSPTPIKVNGLRSAAASAKSFFAVGNRKKYVTIGAVIVAVVLVFMFISGFFASNSTKIIGKWQIVDVNGNGLEGHEDEASRMVMEFKKGDLVSVTDTETGKTQTRRYEVNGDRLLFYQNDMFGHRDETIVEIEKLTYWTMVLKKPDGTETQTYKKI